jgi:AbrB family looped-hinge helix DNA binding protein
METHAMALVKLLRGGQVTLPAETRRMLRLKEGDYLDAEIVEGSLRLKPVKVVHPDEADRQLDQILGRVRYVGSEPEPSEDEVMEMVVEAIHDGRP